MDMTRDSAAATPIRHAGNTLRDITWFKTAERVQDLREQTGKTILLHRSNSLEKTRIARHCGFDGIELDAIYDPRKRVLMVGHEAESASGLPLESFLKVMSDWPYKKI